jgi:hypothetical protein
VSNQTGLQLGASAVLAVVLVAAACGGHSGGLPGDSPGDDDSGTGFGGSGSGGQSSGSGSGGIGFGSSGAAASSSGSGSTPGGCDPSCAAAGGTCASSTCTLGENPGALPAATQTKLQAGGSADGSFAWLYPYDQTVFPRGLLSPTLQFAGGASDGEYVHITSKSLDYKGYFAGGAAGSVKLGLSQKAWDAVAAFVGAGDVAKVEVTKISGGNVSGPVTESWPIAQGTIRGTVYYETYGSTVAGGRNSVAILKINPGATKPAVFQGSTGACGAICHAASADGSTIVSATSLGASASWNVQAGAAITRANNSDYTYMGLYPDGSFGMTATNFGAFYTPSAQSRLFDTKTGAAIAAPGWDSVVGAGGTPSFSDDGKQIAFVHLDKDAHTLAKADFAVATKTFSGVVDLATGAAGNVAWPAFTPDGKSVLYQVGSDPTFETDCQNTGDLYAVDVATHTVRRLDVLDGYSGTGTTSYLPAKDPDLNFAPTMLGEAVGGYFWAIFTSHRSYGSLLASKANSNGLGISNCANPQGDEANGKLWLAAIDINATPGQDPSHPAFYLDGQELQADNLRGYWVLPACANVGAGCASGDECCSGFCRAEGGNGPQCVTPPKGCSNEFEACTTAAECCTTGDQCINDRCAAPAAPR